MKKVVRFSAHWCSPCKALEKQLANNNIVCDSVIDIETDSDAAMKAAVRSVPTLIVYENDSVVRKFIGGPLKPDDLKALQQLLA
jgi:thioredoxin-like negative regulator of GroEL